MINVEVVSEYNFWNKQIKKLQNYFKKKIKNFSSFFSLNKKSFKIKILLTNNKKMKFLNKKFRKKNKETDVLSFPFWEKIQLKKNKNKNLYLGDIAISYEYVKNRSKISNFKLELDKMWIHGILHLLGYDHKKNKDYYKMKKTEDKILKYFHKKK
mgnify:CR=1 FL=1